MKDPTRARTPRSLSLVTAGLWVISLPLTALVFSRSHELSGGVLLMTGWIAPLTALNFAWYANVFFLFGLFRAFAGRRPVWSPLCAALLALDTLRLRRAPLDLGINDSISNLHGYGWGAALWFLAIFMLLIVSGAQAARPTVGTRLRVLGIVLCVLTVTTTAWMWWAGRPILH